MHRGFMDLPSADPPFPFTPSGPEEWKQFTIVFDNEEYLTFFRVQFEFEEPVGQQHLPRRHQHHGVWQPGPWIWPT